MGAGRSRSIRFGVAVVLATGLALLSSSYFLPTGCDTVLGISYHPADTTIRVGESFHPVMNLTSCGGTKNLSPVLRYSADDTTVLQVDAIGGKITGRASGQTTAYVSADQYGIKAPVAVTVR